MPDLHLLCRRSPALVCVAFAVLLAAAPGAGPSNSSSSRQAAKSPEPPDSLREEAPELRGPVGVIGSFSGDGPEAMAADLDKALRWIRIKKQPLPSESIGLLRDPSAVAALTKFVEDSGQPEAVRAAFADTLVLKSFNIFENDPGAAEAVNALLRLEATEQLPIDVRNRTLRGLVRCFIADQECPAGLAMVRLASGSDGKDPHAAMARDLMESAVRHCPEKLDHFAESDVTFIRETAAREIRRLRSIDKTMCYRDIATVEGWKQGTIDALQANLKQLNASLKNAQDKQALNQEIADQRKLLAEAKATPLPEFVARAVRLYDNAKAEAVQVEAESRQPEPRPASEVLPVVTYTATHEEPVYRNNVLVGTRTVEDGERTVDLGFWAGVLLGPANTDRTSYRIRAAENLRRAKETLDQLDPSTIAAARKRLEQTEPEKSRRRTGARQTK